MTNWACPGRVVRVIDGDTIVCDIDLGYHVTVRWAVRVNGLAAPELSTDKGKEARSFAQALLPAGTAVEIVSRKLLGSFEKYGRVLADLTYVAGAVLQTSFSDAMIAAGHGAVWDGTGKQPG